MPAVWGVLLAVATVLVGRVAGFDRDRAFYPVVLIVTASYYDLYAAIGGSRADLIAEAIAFALFAAAAIAGFRTTLWLVAAGFVAHAVFDLIHGALIANPGVPAWWPAFCLAYDLAAALGMALLLRLAPPRPA